MKGTGKRIISILLSALMVITMIPSFAFNAYADDAALTALDNAITAYETKMNGTVYKNMSAAYTAYVNANKARDAYVYGGANIDIASLATTLSNATNAMTGWSAHSGSVPVYLCTEAVDYYSNVLYATAQGKDNQSFSGEVEIGDTSWGAQRKVNYKTVGPSTVVLYYNGNLNDLYFPVAFEAYARNDKNRTIRYVDFNGDANIELKGYWRGYQQTWDNTYGLVFTRASTSSGNGCTANDEGYNSTLGVVEIGYSSSNTKNHKLSKDGSSKNRFFVNKAYIKALSNNTLSKTGGITMRMNTDYGTKTNTNSSKIYVVNYYQLTQAINNNKSKFSNVTSYKQGGLSAVMTAFDKVTSFNISQYKSGATAGNGYTDGTVTAISESNAGDYYTYVQNFCTHHASALASVTAGSSDSDYSSLRAAIDYEGTIEKLGDNQTHSVREMAAVENGADLYSNFETFESAYTAAKNHMAAIYGGSYSATSVADSLSSALLTAFNNLGLKGCEAPTVSGATRLGPNDSATIINNEPGATVYYTVTYDSSETPAISDSFTGATLDINVFDGSTEHSTATVVAYAQNSGGLSDEDSVSFNLLAAPSFKKADNSAVSGSVAIAANEKIKFAAANGDIQYSIDGGAYTAYTTDGITPFDGSSASTRTVAIKAIEGTSTSAVATLTVLRNATFSIYTENCEKGSSFYDDDSVIKIEDTTGYTDDIVYTISIDGQPYTKGSGIGGIYTYAKGSGINLADDNDLATDIKAANYIEIVAYAAPHGSFIGNFDTIKVQATLVNVTGHIDSLVYHESFDGASVNGSSFTTGSAKGVNGTLANSGSASVLSTAGGLYDKRNNVLKINAASAASRGNYIQLENPLSSPIASAFAKENGVTISFWRHMDANCEQWLNALNFTSYDSEHTENRYRYATMTATGRLTFVQRDNDGGNASGGGYMDYFPNNNDITNHSASAVEGYWMNIVLTVDPNKSTLSDAFTMYLNGEPHDVNAETLAVIARSKGGDYSTMEDSEVIDAFLDFITDKNTHFDFAYGGYDEEDKNLDLYLDDIRIYTEVKTQVDINNMYTDDLTDAKAAGVDYKSSTSHDPTNVTVYTLKSAVATDNGTKAAGSQVGQEFIDYYNVPSSNYTVEYYSFGTGLTVYKSTDNVNWTCVGDSQGRFGYQNQELFVSANGEAQSYLTTLKTPLDHAANGVSRNGDDTRPGAAGKLVWAPHVMYNLDQDKWMYYGSTSAWQSNYSAVFLLTSDYVDHGYKYQEIIVKTDDNSGTNAIDSCVYYGHNADGSIDKTKLYCLYGSWGNIMVKQIGSNGFKTDSEDSLGSLLSVARGGGEGGYMTYENGYYYYFISPGANGWAQDGGAYHIRAYRSTSPTSGFVSVAGTLATAQTDPHGNALITGYENIASNYQYRSIGHSSVYTAYNNYNEKIYINAAHTREFSKGNLPVEDGQLATRQIWLVGNVAIHNPVAFTKDGWPVAFPKLYDETFSFKNRGADSETRVNFTAHELEGEYSANSMTTDGSVAPDSTVKLFAFTNTTGVVINTQTGEGHGFELSYAQDNAVTYITLKNTNGSVYAEGVIANQGTNGAAVPMFSLVRENGSSAAYNVWGIRKGDNTSAADIEDAFENTEVASANGVAYHGSNVATGGYSNVLYSPINTTFWTADGSTSEAKVTIKKQKLMLATPELMVLLYDGANEVSYPVAFETYRNESSGKEQYIHYVATNSSKFSLDGTWEGYTNNKANWPAGDIVSSVAIPSATSSGDSFNSNNLNFSGTTWYWSNKMVYSGSGDTTNYYEIVTNDTFNARVSTQDEFLGIAYNREYANGTLTSKSTRYILNYKPVYQILTGAKKVNGTDKTFEQVIDDIKANPTKYSTGSVQSVYIAMEYLTAANPNEYINANMASSSVDGAVKACALKIKLAVDAFEAINMQERSDFSGLYAAYNQADSILSELNGIEKPMFTKASIDNLIDRINEAKPTVYLTDEEKADYGKADTQEFIDSLQTNIENAIATLENYQESQVDLSVYDEVIENASNVDQDAFDVTQAEIDELVAYYTETINDTVTYEGSSGDSTITVVSDDITPENIDTIAKTIIEYLNDRLKMYKVEVEGESITPTYSGNGKEDDFTRTEIVDEQEVEVQYHGATMNTVANFESSDPNTAWYMEYESATAHRTKQFQGYGQSFSTKVLGDVKVWAVNAQTTEGNTNKLSVMRRYSDKADKHPVSFIDFVGDSYTLPAAPEILGYRFDGYEIVDGYEANGSLSGNALNNISGEVQIEAVYTLTSDDNFTVKVYNTNGEELADPEKLGNTFNYNDNINVTDEDAFGWVEKIGDTYRPYYIGSTLNFFVSEATEIKAVATAQEFYSYGSTPAININKSNARNVSGTKNKTYFNGQIVPSENANVQIIEYGFVIGMEKTTEALSEDLVILENIVNNENYRVIRAKSTKDLVGANQFAIAVNGLTNKIIYKGYIIYQDSNGLIKTVYTNPVSMNL